MYQLKESSSITRIPDGATIPADPANRDYAEYLEWIAAGNVPEPYQPPPTPDVTTVTKLRFVEWCEANNRLDDLLALLNSDAILKFKWDAATALDITNPLVQGAAQQLQLDAQAVFNEIGQ